MPVRRWSGFVEAVGGEPVAKLLLPQLEGMLAPTASWTSRHAALVAIATVSEHGSSVIEPHLQQLVTLLLGAAGAGEARLRWASCYAAALLCDEFPQLTEKMHEQVTPMLIAAIGDTSPRVRSAACLACVNLVQEMEEAVLMTHAQALLSPLHAIISAPNAPDYVVFAACSALAAICNGLEEHPTRPMGSAYAAFMPHLAQRLVPAVSIRYGKLGTALLACLGGLTAASGAASSRTMRHPSLATLPVLLAARRSRRIASPTLDPHSAYKARGRRAGGLCPVL